MPRKFMYPANLNNQDLNPAYIQFSYFERKSVKTSAPSDTIQLYMPQNVESPSTVSWNTESLGFLGNQISGLANGTNEGFGATVGDVASVATSKSLANAGAFLAQRMGGNVSAEAVLGVTQGKLANPYVAMIFRGVDLRHFQFTFQFTPFQESDCQLITNIIDTMRANALPEGKGSTGEAFLGYPNECEITYMWKGKPNKWLKKFKRSVCTGIDVNYTGAGKFSVMRNGFPSMITVNTQWAEIETVLKKDVLSDGY